MTWPTCPSATRPPSPGCRCRQALQVWFRRIGEASYTRHFTVSCGQTGHVEPTGVSVSVDPLLFFLSSPPQFRCLVILFDWWIECLRSNSYTRGHGKVVVNLQFISHWMTLCMISLNDRKGGFTKLLIHVFHHQLQPNFQQWPQDILWPSCRS